MPTSTDQSQNQAPKPIAPGGRDRVDFDAAMVTVRYLVKMSDPDLGKYFFRELQQQTRLLERLHGLKV